MILIPTPAPLPCFASSRAGTHKPPRSPSRVQLAGEGVQETYCGIPAPENRLDRFISLGTYSVSVALATLYYSLPSPLSIFTP